MNFVDSACGDMINIHFFDSWSEPMSWCLGLVATDGCLQSVRRVLGEEKCGESVHIGSTDYEIIEKFVKFTGSTYAIGKSQSEHGVYSWRTKVHNKELYYRLVELGLKDKKSLDLKFPRSYPEEWMPGFVRGCWDGDGSVLWQPKKSNFYCTIGTGSKDFIYGLDEYLTKTLNLSEHTINIVNVSKNIFYRIALCGENARKLCRYMYHDKMGEAYLTRKYRVWKEYKLNKNI